MFDLTLSFDNGPEPDVTPGVLDALAAHGILSTFFVIGEKLQDPQRRALVARAHEAGHWIGNHTFTHSVPFGDSQVADAAAQEIGRTQTTLGDLAHPDRLFRPYAGGGGALGPRLFNRAAVRYLVEGRYTCVLWNAIPHDWDNPDGWVETALAQCRAEAWSLMVVHDLPTGAMRHLPRFLDGVRDAGGRVHQAFPPACVPIVRGERVLPLDGYVSDER